MKKAIIMRGLPGSGKSTWVHMLKERAVQRTGLSSTDFPIVCSTDSYFVDKYGHYQFVKEEIGIAHQVCMSDFVRAVSYYKDELVVVDNTNLTNLEIMPYYRVAEAFGYEIKIVEIECDPEVAFARNVHSVPREKFDAMVKRIETLHPLFVSCLTKVKAD